MRCFRGLLALMVVGVCLSVSLATDWPQWLGPQRDGVWRETGIVDKLPEGELKPTWRVPLGTGYAGPAVANDKVYVMDRHRKLDAQGKPIPPAGRGKPVPGYERLLCISAKEGNKLWEHQYECDYMMSYGFGPRTTPVIENDRVYMLGGMGDMKCLDANTGKVIWEKSLPKEYNLSPINFGDPKTFEKPAATPAWGYSGHLLVDGDLIYSLVGGDGSAIVAFNKNTGKEVWRSMTANEVCYAAPMIFTVGGTRHLIAWFDEHLHGLDPATGKEYWKYNYPGVKLPQRPACSIHTPRLLGDKLFISTVYAGSLVMQLTGGDKPDAKVVWQSKSLDPNKPDGLYIMMAPPVLKDGHVYGTCANGELRCLRLADGKEQWNTLAPTMTKKQYERAEKRLKAALAGEKLPAEKAPPKGVDIPPDKDAAGKPKMKGVDCGNCFLIPIGDNSNRFAICNDQGELIIAEMSPGGYHEISRAKLIEPNHAARGRDVVWSHPAFANKCVYARNDKEIICVPLSAN
jgi:outer membrane protein assembly factor BamB